MRGRKKFAAYINKTKFNKNRYVISFYGVRISLGIARMHIPFLFGDENVEENVVKFSRFYGHVHRKNAVNFLLVEVRFGSVQFAEC